MTKFQTTAAYLSGAVCGPIWWPVGQLCGTPIQIRLNAPAEARAGRWYEAGDTFREFLLGVLQARGGDFQAAYFSGDTVIRIERRAVDGPGQYRVHVREIEVGRLPGCDDLVMADAYTGDFLGEEGE